MTQKTYLFANLKTLVLLCLSGIIIFFATVYSPFLYDDSHVIQDNPYIKDLSKYQEIIGIQNIFNRSILLLTFSINYALGQDNVFGYHIVNILIHICVGIVIYFLTRDLLSLEKNSIKSKLKNLPLIASLIHLFNPVTVGSVTYISSRSSLLVTLLYVLSFYFVVQFNNKKTNYIYYLLLATFLFFVGLGVKEIIITLPVMIVFYFWVQSSKKNIKQFVPELIAILLPLMLYLLYRYVEMGNLLVIKTDPYSHMIDRGLYFLTQIKVIISYYLLKLVLPINLNFEPDIRLVSGFLDWHWISALLIGGTLAYGIFQQKSILLKGSFLWALITVLPTSSIIPLKQIATEHRTYLPGIGISIAMGIIFLQAVSIKKFVQPVFLSFLVVYGFLAMKRGLDYRTEVTIWEDTAKKSPYKSMVHNNLGTSYLSDERLIEAKKSFEASMAISPSSTNTYINLGHIHAKNKEWKKAKAKFDLALKLGSRRSQVFFNAGLMRLRLNDPEEALPYLLKAVDIKSHRPTYHYELGNAFRLSQQNDLALQSYRKTIELDPNHLEAQNNIGVIFWNLQMLNKATTEFKKALQIDPSNIPVNNNLANLYIAQKLFSKAIPHLQTVIDKQPNNLRAKNLLHVIEIIRQKVNP